MLACPACKATKRIFDRTIEHAGVQHQFWICNACSSGYYDPPPVVDYSEHTASEFAIRDYVESNASISTLGSLVLSALSNRQPGRFLDVGCGFGFSVDIARRLAGWDCIGVEPSAYGRIGAKILGYRGIHEIIDERHPVAAERFDVIFSSEVIEHSSEPESFVRLCKSMLRAGGLLAIGTPRIDAVLFEQNPSEALAILSPGAHTVVFSKQSYLELFRRLGFKYVEVVPEGSSMMAYASDAPLNIETVDGVEVAIQYARAVLADCPRYAPLEAGLKYRLFRHLVDRGRLREAMEVESQISFPNLHVSSRITDAESYLRAYPAHAAIVTYSRAMLALNGTADYCRSRELFLASHMMCAQRIRYSPALAVEEAQLIWNALYHAGLASAYNHEMAEAQWCWLRLALLQEDAAAPISDEWRARALLALEGEYAGNSSPAWREVVHGVRTWMREHLGEGPVAFVSHMRARTRKILSERSR